MKTRSLLVLMAATIMVPVMIISWLGLNMLLEQERESRLLSVRETARAAALAIDRQVAASEAALRILSHSDYIVRGEFRALHELMTLANKTPYSWTVLSDYEGKPLVNTLVPFGTPLFAASKYWAAKTIDSQRTTVTDFIIGPLAGKPIVAINVPLPPRMGKPYVLSQVFLASYFEKAFRVREIPSSWIVGVFGSDGITIVRSKSPEQFVGKMGNPQVLKESRHQFTGVVRHPSREGIDIYDVYTRTQLTDWTIAIGVPAEEIEAPARRAAWYAAFALLAIFALAAVAVIFLARRLSGSLADAVDAAEKLGAGVIPEAKPSPVEEVGVLQSALHRSGLALAGERETRRRLEEEKEELLRSEQEARRYAEAQNRAKDDFLAMLGHELRNPLAAVSSAIAVMELDHSSGDQIKRAREIGRRQTDHLARIVDDLLDISRIMAGKIELRRQRIDLGAVANRCAQARRAAHQDRHAWTIRTEPAWIDADATRLEQIVDNLLTNAVKYTPAGGQIEVSVRQEDGEAVLEVRDTGIGIPPELLQRVFDVFVQGPTALDRSAGGLGLGLSLVRQLAALHGGTVQAASAGKGQGSTFTLRFPCADTSAGRPETALTASGAPSVADRSASPRRILLVEDNEDGREMLVAMLELHGFEVIDTGNGMEAVRLAAERSPRVAVVDIGLPGIDGYEVARRLRADPATRDMRLIALTGYGMEQDRLAASTAGFDLHLTKPYTIAALLDALTSEKLADTRPGSAQDPLS